MFDTHCHLNFKAFKKNLDSVILNSKNAGVKVFLVPGTDIQTSEKAVEIAEKYNGVYAAVGIHPHHIYQYQKSNIKNQIYILNIKNDLEEMKRLLLNKKVVAIGEVGIDLHPYQKTQYENYQVDDELVNLQKELFSEQIKLAIKYGKSLILHNREGRGDFLEVLDKNWDTKLESRTVFHCFEPDEKMLEYAVKHKIFIGVDGDITYYKKKQQFIKKIPLERLVLETDAPFLLPEPLKSQKKYPNVPANIKIIVEFIAKILQISKEELVKTTSANSQKLFNLQ